MKLYIHYFFSNSAMCNSKSESPSAPTASDSSSHSVCSVGDATFFT